VRLGGSLCTYAWNTPTTGEVDEGARAGIDLHLASTWQLQLSHRAVRASSDEQRTGYELGVAIVQTAEGRSHDVKVNHMTL
jgi:hypothetical protein